MPQHKFVVKCAGSYGKKGTVVALNTDELTDRQKVMLEPYSEPEVKVISGGKGIDLTDKKAVVAELERLKIEFDGRKGVEELAALLPKA